MTVDAPEIRIYEQNSQPVRRDGEFVLYWMIANRRTKFNFGLDRAIAWSRKLGKPLLILEALRIGYPWASERLHQFVIDGMRDNAADCDKHQVAYYPYLEGKPDAGRGLLEGIAANACVVVTDEFPCFFLPRMVIAAAKRIDVRLESVDSNGLYPLRATELVFSSAHQFRRHLQKNLPAHLEASPSPRPFADADFAKGAVVAAAVQKRWPRAKLGDFVAGSGALQAFSIDHEITATEIRGGAKAAATRLKKFIDTQLARYGEERNQPEKDAASGLSPYLHFGHISVHEVFQEAMKREGWNPSKLNPKAHGSREDWWRTSAPLESFLDELITWRELGYHFCARTPNYDQFESLPGWAQATLEAHSSDRRKFLYSLEQFELAQTHDPLWNAAQRQLVREGKIHNYLRMLWGKKILEWSESPQAALEVMIELNNKYALDGRNPNSYSGIFWTLGRFDRPWGPERPVFGSIRYMSSENTARKVSVKQYLRTYAETPPLFARNSKQGGS
jgi:deoxyribodipyrimidine photo-lyase